MKWRGLRALPFPFPHESPAGAFTHCTCHAGYQAFANDIPHASPRGEEMKKMKVFQNAPSDGCSPPAYPAKKQARKGEYFLICTMLIPLLLCGCNNLNGGIQAKSAFQEANAFFSQGNYQASLNKYEQIIEKDPAARDRVLFEMGIIHAYPKNEHKDYQKSIECFQKLIKDYPASEYRHDSEMMIFNINNVILKDRMISAQQAQIEALRQELASKGNEISALQLQMKALDQKVFDFAVQKRSVDRILIEKKERRLTLSSQGEVLKIYKIALGGNPIGPKERQGDNKTPEGTYVIDSKNKNSHYHQALHVSYPNERDKKRARELGVSPGGDIMIHGIKKDFSWVGDKHTEVDWTKGCIAVTSEEIEEIYKLAPIGTVVEIRP